MKKAFVTGATGFIGYHLLRTLLDNDVEIWALCRKDSKDFQNIKKIKGVHIIPGDLCEAHHIPELCEERNFDVFYHLAWLGASGGLRASYDVQLQNVKWTCDCVEVAKKLQCKKIVVTGTICEKQCEDILEKSYFAKSSYYLFAKKYANQMAKCISRKVDISFVWCSFYHPIGVYNKKEQLIANTLKKLLYHEKTQFGLAQGLFDVIDVRDLAYALYLMGEKDLEKNEYFVGSGDSKKLMEYLEQEKNIINPSANLGYGEVETAELIMKSEWMDTIPFQRETGFSPSISFSESIKTMQAWMENEEKYDSEKWFF